jgi:hypothetical protein
LHGIYDRSGIADYGHVVAETISDINVVGEAIHGHGKRAVSGRNGRCNVSFSVNCGDRVATIVGHVGLVAIGVYGESKRAGSNVDRRSSQGISIDYGHGIVAVIGNIDLVRVRIDRCSNWRVSVAICVTPSVAPSITDK